MFYHVYGSPSKKLQSFVLSKIITISYIYLYYYEREGRKQEERSSYWTSEGEHLESTRHPWQAKCEHQSKDLRSAMVFSVGL